MPDTLSDQSRHTAVANSAGTNRALVPLTLPLAQGPPRHRAFRPDARFVAHLIASAVHAPQARMLRRAAAGQGVASYGDALARERLRAAVNGLVLSRVA